eukprot:gb/GEZN01002832.1/.p1 GENE.gb/GEZN01002832.1/~~gb/GEZN01002832.1/.p1  ORF type:complete len:421 (-),score=70.74 gb/GEZN01002832.1/:981-2243(-)
MASLLPPRNRTKQHSPPVDGFTHKSFEKSQGYASSVDTNQIAEHQAGVFGVCIDAMLDVNGSNASSGADWHGSDSSFTRVDATSASWTSASDGDSKRCSPLKPEQILELQAEFSKAEAEFSIGRRSRSVSVSLSRGSTPGRMSTTSSRSSSPPGSVEKNLITSLPGACNDTPEKKWVEPVIAPPIVGWAVGEAMGLEGSRTKKQKALQIVLQDEEWQDDKVSPPRRDSTESLAERRGLVGGGRGRREGSIVTATSRRARGNAGGNRKRELLFDEVDVEEAGPVLEIASPPLSPGPEREYQRVVVWTPNTRQEPAAAIDQPATVLEQTAQPPTPRKPLTRWWWSLPSLLPGFFRSSSRTATPTPNSPSDDSEKAAFFSKFRSFTSLGGTAAAGGGISKKDRIFPTFRQAGGPSSMDSARGR